MRRELSHIDGEGQVRMVDISRKGASLREAVACGTVHLTPGTLSRIARNAIPKGNVFTAARLAGILAAKKVDEIIPLCHPLPLTHVAVDFTTCVKGGRGRIRIEARARTVWGTGVEMEALTAVAAAALTIYDMCKAVERGMRIGDIRLLRKTTRRPPRTRGPRVA